MQAEPLSGAVVVRGWDGEFCVPKKGQDAGCLHPECGKACGRQALVLTLRAGRGPHGRGHGVTGDEMPS
jgi:hypothetical protein